MVTRRRGWLRSVGLVSEENGGPMTRRKVGILVFPEVEVLDFCEP